MENVSVYVPDWKAYFTLQEIEDEVEYKELRKEVRKFFDEWNNTKLTLDQLRRIYKIMKENSNA